MNARFPKSPIECVAVSDPAQFAFVDSKPAFPKMFVDATSDHFIVKYSHCPELDILMKVKGRAQWDDRKTRQYWYAPRRIETVVFLREHEAEWTPAAVEAAMWTTFDCLEREDASNRHEAEMDIGEFGAEGDRVPRPYQVAGAAYALEVLRGIIGDEPGLGKTLQGLLFFWMLRKKFGKAKIPRALIICPAKLKGVWLDECKRAMPQMSAIVFDSKTAKEHSCNEQLNLFSANYSCPGCRLDGADILITNYDQLADGWVDDAKKKVKLSAISQRLLEIGFAVIEFDEVHYLKNGSSQRTKAAKILAKSRDYRLGMTGTVVVNRAGELISILTALDRLQDFGGYMQFKEDWVYALQTEYRGRLWTYTELKAKWLAASDKFKPKIQEALDKINQMEAERRVRLNKELRRICYIRRQKKEVLGDLPPKVWQTIPVEIDNEKEYRKAEDDIARWAWDRVLEDKKFLLSIQHEPAHIREFMIAQRQQAKADSANAAPELVKLSALRYLVARGKLKGAKDWIDEFLETEEKLIFFAMHKDIIEQLLYWYPDACRITSASKQTDIDSNVARFQQDPTAKLFLGAMGTSIVGSPAGMGHTLTAASHVAFLEFGWNRAHHKQCEDRAHRFGSEKFGHECINIYHLLGRLPDQEWTIDWKHADLIDEKRKIAEGIEDGKLVAEDASIVDALVSYLAQKGEHQNGTAW